MNNTVIDSTDHYNYVFNYTDHLGNIRLSYASDPKTTELKILEENNYYPFGLKHANYNWSQQFYQDVEDGDIMIREKAPLPYQYKYNGKEWQDELGLNFYDYGARNYDPAIGRWMNIDPLAEQYRRWSPYNYGADNPVRFIDPDGMGLIDFFNMQGDKIGTDGNDSDDRKVVVKDRKEAKSIAKTDKNGGTTQLSDVSSGVVLPSDTALQESVNVLDKMVANGGLREESSIVMCDGTVLQGQTGPVPTISNNIQTAPSTLPALPAGTTPADAEVTIHGHPTTVQQVGSTIYPQSASIPSSGVGSDGPTFQQYNTNIIVGPLGTISAGSVTTNPNGTLNIPKRTNGAAIYDNNSNLKVELSKKAIQNILSN